MQRWCHVNVVITTILQALMWLAVTNCLTGRAIAADIIARESYLKVLHLLCLDYLCMANSSHPIYNSMVIPKAMYVLCMLMLQLQSIQLSSASSRMTTPNLLGSPSASNHIIYCYYGMV
jgi:hypothetical protein